MAIAIDRQFICLFSRSTAIQPTKMEKSLFGEKRNERIMCFLLRV